jgi:hypothetical protein
MIGVLIAVMVVVGIVAGADLLLSFAIVRRLAQLETRGGGTGGGPGVPAVGHKVGEFRVPLVTGDEFTSADLEGSRALVVFVMPSCEPCKKAIADLQALPRPLSWPLYVLVTATEEEDHALDVAGDLPPGTRVAAIFAADSTARAFGVDAFPTALIVEDGVVRAAGLQVSGLLENVRR